MIGVGLAWASMIGNPYVMLAGSIPPERVGVYMGIFNMFIVIPMMIQIFTLPLFYDSWLGGNPENVIRLAGSLLICGAVAVLFVKLGGSGGRSGHGNRGETVGPGRGAAIWRGPIGNTGVVGPAARAVWLKKPSGYENAADSVGARRVGRARGGRPLTGAGRAHDAA